jgi:DUF4097 and DUF4098 domain-containing protein YvlB
MPRWVHSEMRLSLFLMAVALPLVYAQEPALTREGRYWIKTINGAGRLAQSRVLIKAAGDITVRSGAQNNYSYTVKLRVRAATERQAQARLAALQVYASTSGDRFVLKAPASGESDVMITLPRSLKEVAVSTTGGVDITDLACLLTVEAGGGIRCDRIQGNVEVSTAGGGISLGTIDGTVRCVTGGGGISANVIRGDAVFSTGGGDIMIQQVGGLVRASTAGGGIKIASAGSAVIASTAGGPIQVERAKGQVTVKSSAGPIQVNSASNVECQSAAGAIRMRDVSGSLRASTASGSIITRLLRDRPFADSSLTTGSGDITVFIPSNLAVTIHAENEFADNLRRIVSDFPAIAVRLAGSAVVAEGAINGGGPVLRIKATNGTIYIKKQ